MKPSFWIRRFVFVFLGVFAVLAVAGFARARPWQVVLADSALWSALSSTLFVAARLYQSSRGRHCALCGDTPETAPDKNRFKP
jgi:hypothetical protein